MAIYPCGCDGTSPCGDRALRPHRQTCVLIEELILVCRCEQLFSSPVRLCVVVEQHKSLHVLDKSSRPWSASTLYPGGAGRVYIQTSAGVIHPPGARCSGDLLLGDRQDKLKPCSLHSSFQDYHLRSSNKLHPPALALPQVAGVFTNLFGGVAGSKYGLRCTLLTSLALQVRHIVFR